MTRGRWSALNVTLVALTVVLVVAVAVFGVLFYQDKDRADQRDKAVQSARQMGVNLMSVSHKTAQRDLDRIVAGATGELKNQFSTQSKKFLDQVTQAQATSTVSQVDAAYVSGDDDSAEVMVSLNGMVTNPKVTQGVPRPYRYLMDLTRTDDRWLVSKLEMVP
ncbi:hypothetical protein GCM10009678_89180 [Actinomadura kijaniata]|uniref:Mce-associated membrane protein n=1 Tax=Actinomadura namibiensis TaxID=182080 RepID=A0A7W3M0S7_ACTNM|nr:MULTISPECIES: hypothetical protein [Actinomadura]MBA8957759.1 Mce-associated membrane protein [Actinomadura namibiensis]